jgi:hypothetical protein
MMKFAIPDGVVTGLPFDARRESRAAAAAEARFLTSSITSWGLCSVTAFAMEK